MIDKQKIDNAAQRAKERAKALTTKITADKEFRDRWIGVFIGILALAMAVCTLKGNNVTKDANRLHIEANNVWNFFQAKNLRRQIVRHRIAELETALIPEAPLVPAVREAMAKQLASYRTLDAQLTSDKEKNEGLDELFTRGKALEAERDVMLRMDPYFDGAQTLLQIAIVLASVCLVTGTMWLLYVSGILGVIGTLLMLNGNFLLVSLPFMS